MTAGRPPKYEPWMLDKIENLMNAGASKVEVAAELGIHRDTLHEWCKSNLEFSDAIKRGEFRSQAWWERQGRISLKDKEFNSTLWIMNVKNRFREDWSDKTEVNHTGAVEISSAILNARKRIGGEDATPEEEPSNVLTNDNSVVGEPKRRGRPPKAG